MAAAVFERFDSSGDFQHTIADGIQAVRFVGFGEQFGLHYAGEVGDGDELHRFAGDLVEEALLDDQTTGNDLLAKMVVEPVDRAISIPGNIRKQFERMAANWIAEEFLFGAQTLEASGFGKRDGGEMREVGGGKKPGLSGRVSGRWRNIEL